ncbi:MAG: PEP-CTERM sorting domain-containing protein [Tepidisphaeraceae bacterium]|jgi:hypothetical protein
MSCYRESLRAAKLLRACFLTLVVLICCSQTAHAQNLLVNGSFELPSMGETWVPDTEPTSWTVTNPNDAELLLPSSYSLSGTTLPATDGTQDMYMDNSSIQESASLTASTSYSLSFDLSTEIGAFAGQNAVADLTISDGVQTLTPSAFVVSAGSNSWSHEMFNFTALDSGPYTLSMAAPSGDTTIVDNVVLAANTPEPNSLGLVALIGAGLMLRRHRAKTGVH